MVGIRDYSTTADANLSVAGISLAEGWARASVNNAYRAGMSDIANLLLDTGGETLTTGSSNAYLLNLPSAPTAYADNLAFICRLNHTATGAATMNINGLGVKDFKKMQAGVPTALSSGDARSGDRAICVYSSSANAVLMLNTQAVFTQSGAGAITWPITDRMKQQVYLLDFIPQSEHAAILASTSTYDCSAAFLAAMNSVDIPVEDNPVPYMGGPEVIFPYGTCYFDSTIEIKKTMILSGQSSTDRSAWASSLEFKAGITGITVNSRTGYQGDLDPPTMPIPGVMPISKGGDGTIIRNLKLRSKSIGVRNPALNETGEGVGHGIGHGIWCRAVTSIEHCCIQYFPQHGIYVRAVAFGATAPNTPENRALYGNANCMFISRTSSLTNGGCGLYIDGPDTNAGIFQMMNFGSNRLSAIHESSLIGNVHIQPQADNNGTDSFCHYPTATSATGLGRFYCRDKYRANNDAPNWAASTDYLSTNGGQFVRNAGNLYKCTLPGTSASSGGPTGTLASIADGSVIWAYVSADANIRIPPDGHAQSADVWGYIQAAANPELHPSYPLWPYLLDGVTFKDYRLGYCYWFDQVSAKNVFIGPYIEGGQASSLIIAPSIVFGQLIYDAASTGVFLQGAVGYANIGPAIQVNAKSNSTTDYVSSINVAADATFTMRVAGDGNVAAINASEFGYIWDTATGTWMIQHARNSGRIAQRFTTTLNTLTGGRASAIGAGNALFTQGMWLGRATTYTRHLTMGEALPISGQWAAGDYVMNATPGGVGAVLGWRCVTTGDFAGTPPVFQAVRPSTSQQTIVASAVNPAFTLTPASSPYHTLYSGTMTATRPVTLSTTLATIGMTYRITRTAGGAFDLTVGTGPLKTLTPNTWCDVTFDGTAYYLSAYGAL